MRYLNPTPAHLLTDSSGRPYFLWDSDLSLEQFRARLSASDPSARGYYLAKLLRQAKPDDVFSFVTLDEIERDWAAALPHLGVSRPFWEWLVPECRRRRGDG